MEFQPSSYYLDRLKERAKEREQAAVEAQKASGQYEKAAQEAAVKAEEAARKRAEQRAKDIREIYAKGSPATMWGRDAAVVSKMRDQIFQNLDNFADNPDDFAMAISQLNAYVDNATDLYRQTYKSYEDAMVRTAPGAKNPYESDGFQDANSRGFYEKKLTELDTMTAPNITMNGGQFFIGDKQQDLGTYMQEKSVEADPFAPKPEALPPIDSDYIFARNATAIRAANGGNIDNILTTYFNDPVKLQRVMSGVNGYEGADDKQTLIVQRMTQLEEELREKAKALGRPLGDIYPGQKK